MTTKLSISDLSVVLHNLEDVTKPYQLGLHLDIHPATLKTVEKNHPGDVDRQKTEVIEYWLRNSPVASWISLTNTLDRMGGYANLVQTLRETYVTGPKFEPLHDPQFDQPCDEALYNETVDDFQVEPVQLALPHQSTCTCTIYRKRMPVNWKCWSSSYTHSICLGAPRNILLLGKMGHGKSTIGNRMLNSDGRFEINSQECPQTCDGSAILQSKSRLKSYKITIIDHDGLFEGASTIEALTNSVPSTLDLVIFILKHECNFDENESKILDMIVKKWKISEISALVVTHCEHLSEEEREKMISQFKEDHPSVAELMGKGILAVGFPDNSHVQPGSQLSQSVEDDKKKLKKFIYSCDKRVIIHKSHQLLQVEDAPQHPQTDNRKFLCCSIL